MFKQIEADQDHPTNQTSASERSPMASSSNETTICDARSANAANGGT